MMSLYRAPIIGGRQVTIDTCTSNGELQRQVITKGKFPPELRPAYRACRKCHWGGSWPCPSKVHVQSMSEKVETEKEEPEMEKTTREVK